MSWRHPLAYGPGDLAPRRPTAHSMFGRLGCNPLKRPLHSILALSFWPSSGCRPAARWVVAADGRVNRLRLCALTRSPARGQASHRALADVQWLMGTCTMVAWLGDRLADCNLQL